MKSPRQGVGDRFVGTVSGARVSVAGKPGMDRSKGRRDCRMLTVNELVEKRRMSLHGGHGFVLV